MIGSGIRHPESYILVKHCSTAEINVLVIGILCISGICAWVVQDTIGQFELELEVDLPFLPKSKFAKSLLDLRLVSTLSMFWNGGARLLALLLGFGGGCVLPVVCILLWASLLLPLSYNARKQVLVVVRYLGKWQTCLMFTLMLINKGVSFDKTIRDQEHSTTGAEVPDFGNVKVYMEAVSMGGCIHGLYVLSMLVLFTAATENVNERSFYKTTRTVLPRKIIPSERARVAILVFAIVGLLITLVMFFFSELVGPFIAFKQTGILANIEPETRQHSTLTFSGAMDTSSPREPSRSYFLVGIVIAPIAEAILLIIRATTNHDSRLSLLFSTLITSFNLLEVFIFTIIAIVANIDEVTQFLVADQSQGICSILKSHYREYCFQSEAHWRTSSLLLFAACISFFAARWIVWMTAKSVDPKVNWEQYEVLTRGLITNSTNTLHTIAGGVECTEEEGERSTKPKLTAFGSDEPMTHYAGADEEEGVYHYLHHLLIPGEVELPLSPSASPNFEPEVANIMYSSASSEIRS